MNTPLEPTTIPTREPAPRLSTIRERDRSRIALYTGLFATTFPVLLLVWLNSIVVPILAGAPWERTLAAASTQTVVLAAAIFIFCLLALLLEPRILADRKYLALAKRSTSLADSAIEKASWARRVTGFKPAGRMPGWVRGQSGALCLTGLSLGFVPSRQAQTQAQIWNRADIQSCSLGHSGSAPIFLVLSLASGESLVFEVLEPTAWMAALGAPMQPHSLVAPVGR